MPSQYKEAYMLSRSSSPNQWIRCCISISTVSKFFLFLFSELQQQQRRERLLHLLIPKANGWQRRAFHQRQLPGSAISLQCKLQRRRLFWERKQELWGEEQEIEQPLELQLQLRVTGSQVEPEQITRPRRYHRYIIHRPVLNKPLSARWGLVWALLRTVKESNTEKMWILTLHSYFSNDENCLCGYRPFTVVFYWIWYLYTAQTLLSLTLDSFIGSLC